MVTKIIRKLIFAVIILIALYKVTAYPQSDNSAASNDKICKDMLFYRYETENFPNALMQDKEFTEILLEAYPNPFSIITLITFRLPADRFVNLSITDLKGETIEELVNGETEAGEHRIFFKPAESIHGDDYKCVLQVYSQTANRMYKSERIITYAKGNDLVNRR